MPYDPNTPTNPDQPGYPQSEYPQQPGYGQPQYPQPQYPQPQYPQQPGYGQPGPPSQGMGYGQPGYPSQTMGYGGPPPGGGYPGAYPPPPQQPPKRSRAPLIAGIVGGVLLLCIVACVAGLYFTGNGILGAASSIDATLSATETAQAQPTPTISETVAYQDSMTDSPSGWPNDSTCSEKADGYHVTGGIICFGPPATAASDVDVKVDVQGVKVGSNTTYAVGFRHVSTGNYYDFEITPDGQWAFYKVVDNKPTAISDYQSSSAIQTGAGATNEMRVLAIGSHFVFYVNGQKVGEEDDSTFSSGRVGLGNFYDAEAKTDVVFTNLTVAKPA